jgi:hypothetical protein
MRLQTVAFRLLAEEQSIKSYLHIGCDCIVILCIVLPHFRPVLYCLVHGLDKLVGSTRRTVFESPRTDTKKGISFRPPFILEHQFIRWEIRHKMKTSISARELTIKAANSSKALRRSRIADVGIRCKTTVRG